MSSLLNVEIHNVSLSTNIKYYNFHLGYDIAMHSYKSKYEDIINIDVNVKKAKIDTNMKKFKS